MKDLKKLTHYIDRLTWVEIRKTSRGHLRIVHRETGRTVGFLPRTDSDPRMMKNLLAQLRRAGIEIPEK